LADSREGTAAFQDTHCMKHQLLTSFA
jgi:hypothetical protein